MLLLISSSVLIRGTSLHWLPVHFRILFKILLFVFKSWNGLASSYLSELSYPFAPAKWLTSAVQVLLEVPRTKWGLGGDQAFSIVVSSEWPPAKAPSMLVFKMCLKLHFYSLAFYSLWDLVLVWLFLCFLPSSLFIYCFNHLCCCVIYFCSMALCKQRWLF